MNNNVFRKVSTERLSSPEQLDTLMKVTSPKGWLALTALGILIVAAFVWGFNGSLEKKVYSQGVLIRPGGLQQIYSSSAGQISDIRVVENDVVTKGDVIARIEQPALLEQVRLAKGELDALVAEYGRNPTQPLEGKINDQKTRITALQTEYNRATTAISPYSGRVLEVKVKKGSSVNTGVAIATVEAGGENVKNLEAVLYVPAGEGKQIVPGMKVAISPSSVKKEEYGFMIGRVISVSELPTTRQGMMVTIGNEALVEQLAVGGAALEARIDLVPDSQTESGYEWSTGDGYPAKINSGTLVVGAITVSQYRPITSLFPQIK